MTTCMFVIRVFIPRVSAYSISLNLGERVGAAIVLLTDPN